MRVDHVRKCLIGLAVITAGCGGGGGGGSHSGAGGTEADFGPFTTRAVTTGQPLQAVTASSGGPVFTGIAGGAFSSIVLNPSQDLSQTSILFSHNSAVYAVNPDGTNERLISTTLPEDVQTCHPTWSPDRTKIAYSIPVDNFFQIVVANSDGSNPKVISSGSTDEKFPAWSTTSSKIAFTRYDTSSNHYEIYTRNSDGTGITRLSDKTSDDFWPSWSPDGKKIAFEKILNGSPRIYIMNSDGSQQHALTSFGANLGQEMPAWSPDGTLIACDQSIAGGGDDLLIYSLDGLGVSVVYVNGKDEATGPTWSPDGHNIAFALRPDGSNMFHIVVTDATGGNLRTISAPALEVENPAWSPFASKKTIVGPTGFLGASASGFLFGQSGFNVTSVLAFDSGTPDTTTVSTSDSLPGADNVVFQVSGALTSIKYFNGLLPATTLLPSGSLTTATGALVSFDVGTGFVASVIPFSASRSETPRKQAASGAITYTGTFLAVFDSSGRNMAPTGCKEIRIEPKTGVASAVN